ncbi:EpsG family protein [Flavobacterium psychrophilum]|uniref:EpsG family protein n=1 Tax=Flavobacterium psychrophilum TaxID=96345 RepID=UPI000B7C556D|nr:EpsG family protein [Flavobacterium psychrophilum]EKT3956154.1 EpsG family protein [Flavobacterium psychrophilum]EKT4510216.1 EpsG family protein [Flavobacterium psychrophilum]SNA77212.1 Probable transmembrane protein. Putative polysaccharide export protein [Flavobacterium psychrophilum]SNB10205.1 Probable transmembrane protein. Putative polysaccharide export protein [Flavobacterium psychrophilum]
MDYDLLITILLIILSLMFRKSKFISLIFFIFMWTLWGWNLWNGDYDAYKSYYDNFNSVGDQDFEIGFQYVNLLFVKIGLNFNDYMKVYSFLVLSVVFWFSLKHSKYPALFSAMYFVLFIIEYVFTRNYLAHNVVIIAIFFVLNEVKNYKYLFFLTVILASLIHVSTIICLIFFFSFNTKEVINLKKTVIYVSLIIFMSSVIFDYVVLPLLGNRVLDKFNYYGNTGGFSNVFFVHIIIVLIIYKYFDSVLKYVTLDLKLRRIYIIVLNINILSLYFLILYFRVPYFARILRFLFTFDILFMLNAMYYVNSSKIKLNLSVLLIVIYCAVIGMFLKSTLSLTLFPLYKCNTIWGNENYVPIYEE